MHRLEKQNIAKSEASLSLRNQREISKYQIFHKKLWTGQKSVSNETRPGLDPRQCQENGNNVHKVISALYSWSSNNALMSIRQQIKNMIYKQIFVEQISGFWQTEYNIALLENTSRPLKVPLVGVGHLLRHKHDSLFITKPTSPKQSYFLQILFPNST